MLSITLTNIGLYDLYAIVNYQWFTGTSANNQINYCISTTTVTPDANTFVSGFSTPYFNIATNGLQGVNCRRIYYNTTNPTIYLLVYFSGGAYNYRFATTLTALQSTRIA